MQKQVQEQKQKQMQKNLKKMIEINLICWIAIILMISIGWIKNLTGTCIAIALSLIPVFSYFYFFITNSNNNESFGTSYFYLSPMLLLLTHFLLSKVYKYLYGIEPDPGVPYSNRAKFSNRKLNIGDYIVSIAPIPISLLPLF